MVTIMCSTTLAARRARKASLRDALFHVLADGQTYTAQDLAQRLQSTPREIAGLLQTRDIRSRVYVASWCVITSGYVARWALGEKDDAPNPDPNGDCRRHTLLPRVDVMVWRTAGRKPPVLPQAGAQR